MRNGWTRAMKAVAILAIALHAVTSGLAPAGAVPVDPLSAICHSGGDAAAQAPDQTGSPSAACDHCTLCPVTSNAAPVQAVLIGLVAPARVLHPLTAPTAVIHAGAIDRSQQPRGPPQQA